jgi:hypothetical protein
LIQSAHANFGSSDTDILPIDADVPRPFTGDQLLRSVEATAELLGVSEYVETMQMRIRTLLSDSRMKIVSRFLSTMLNQYVPNTVHLRISMEYFCLIFI